MQPIPVWLGKIVVWLKEIASKITGKPNYLKQEYVGRLIRERHYSTHKLKKAGWQAKTTTEEAVKKTVEEIEKLVSSP